MKVGLGRIILGVIGILAGADHILRRQEAGVGVIVLGIGFALIAWGMRAKQPDSSRRQGS